MSEREPTGAHAIPPPPLVQREPERESGPPITKHGPSWKLVGSGAAVALSIYAGIIGLSYQIGEAAADQRARDREQSAQLERIEATVSVVYARSQRHDEQLSGLATADAVYAARLEAIEEAIEETKRRMPRER